MSAVTLTKRTRDVAEELLVEWSKVTGTENAMALVARSVVDTLLDLKNLASEFDEMDAEARVAR